MKLIKCSCGNKHPSVHSRYIHCEECDLETLQWGDMKNVVQNWETIVVLGLIKKNLCSLSDFVAHGFTDVRIETILKMLLDRELIKPKIAYVQVYGKKIEAECFEIKEK